MYRSDLGFHPETDSRIGPSPDGDTGGRYRKPAHGNLDNLVFGDGADLVPTDELPQDIPELPRWFTQESMPIPPEAVSIWIRKGETETRVWRVPDGWRRETGELVDVRGALWRADTNELDYRSALPAHEDGPDEVPSPWAAAAKGLRLRIGAASLRVDSLLGRLPTPGCTDEADMLALEVFTRALEGAADAGDRLLRLREERHQAERRARQLARAADAIGKS